MKRVPFVVSLVLGLFVTGFAQIPQQYIWKITFVADKEGESKVTVQNRCRDTHEFRISGRNVPYLTFPKRDFRLEGGKEETVPVKVNTNGLKNRTYQGQVTIACTTCRSEKTCSQSSDILNLTLNIVTLEALEAYRPSQEVGIDSPIVISAGSSAAVGADASESEDEIKDLLTSLSDNRGSGSEEQTCGLPPVRPADVKAPEDCGAECRKRLEAMQEAEKRARTESRLAGSYCAGLLQLEKTTAFVEARAVRAQRDLERANKSGADRRVLSSLQQEAENSRIDAEVFRRKLSAARPIVDRAKAGAYASQQEFEDSVASFRECSQGSGCK